MQWNVGSVVTFVPFLPSDIVRYQPLPFPFGHGRIGDGIVSDSNIVSDLRGEEFPKEYFSISEEEAVGFASETESIAVLVS